VDWVLFSSSRRTRRATSEPPHRASIVQVQVILRLTISLPVCLGVGSPSGSRDQSLISFQVQVILRPTVSQPVCLGVGPPSGAHDQIFITVRHLRPSYFGAPSLTRGWVCNLLVQFSVTLQSKSHRTHDHILLSHLRLPEPGGPSPCIYIPQEQGGPLIPPGTGLYYCPVRVPVILQPTVSRPVCLGIGLPLGQMTRF
jgi:hypothetical protein